MAVRKKKLVARFADDALSVPVLAASDINDWLATPPPTPFAGAD